MNIADRARLYCLYSEIRRVPSPGGRLATYDIVLRAGDVIYPTSWAGDGSASFLMKVGGLVIGRDYTLQTTTNLASGAWTTATNFTAAQTTATLTNTTAGAAQLFYRLLGY